VKKHLTRIYDKLGVENRTAAAFYGDRFFSGEG
jgi:DNA-binding CsgD family transcriptional regulator